MNKSKSEVHVPECWNDAAENVPPFLVDLDVLLDSAERAVARYAKPGPRHHAAEGWYEFHRGRLYTVTHWKVRPEGIGRI